jgi:hypothetical protein
MATETRTWERFITGVRLAHIAAVVETGGDADDARAEFDAAVTQHDAEVAAKAWEEGWEAAIDQAPADTWFDEWHYQTNPYGKAT